MITSTQNKGIKNYKKLQQKKYRQKEKLMIVEGEHLLFEAQKHGELKETFHLEENTNFKNGTLLSPHVMKYLTDAKNPPKDIGIVEIPSASKMDDKVLILNNIQDPGNVGTLLRSALAFGFKSVVLDRSADPYSAKVLRSTQGAIFSLNLHFMDVITFKKTHAHSLYGAHLSKGKQAKTFPSLPFALILGNEGSGIEENVIELLDYTITIPMENIESLNVGVAGSIIMHGLSHKGSLIEG